MFGVDFLCGNKWYVGSGKDLISVSVENDNEGSLGVVNVEERNEGVVLLEI